MSKIQKALGLLRDEKGKTEAIDTPERSNADDRSRGAREASGGHRPTINVRAQPGAQAHNEVRFAPSKSVKINVEDLQEGGVIAADEQSELVEHQFRRIKRPLLQFAFGVGVPIERNANVIMVASAMSGAGKSFCSTNLSISIAKERDVGAVLVDADVLKPNISKSMGLEDDVGLIDYLVDRNIELNDILFEVSDLDICVIPAGRKHDEATELLASRRMRDLVSLLSETFSDRAVIFDTPPLLVTNEAHNLAEHMGQVVMVVAAGESSQESVTQALGSLNRDRPINAIMNKTRRNTGVSSGSEYSYYPGSYGELLND